MSASKINMIKEWCWFSQINVFHGIFHIGSMFCFFPASFISSTYTDKNSPFSRLTHKHSQFGSLSQPCSNGTFSNCISHNSPARGWPSRLRSRGTTGSSILDHDFGHVWFVKRTQISGHSDFRFSNYVGASSIFTAACPAYPVSLEIMSMTYAAVICDADDRRKILNHLSQCHLGIRLDLCTNDIEALTPDFWDDKDPSMTRNELFCPWSLLLRSPPFCSWLLSAFHCCLRI